MDQVTRDATEVVKGSGLLVYATPLDVTLELLESHRPHVGPDSVLTDVVSLKAPILRKIRELELASRWVGGHPMAGSERSGYESARADLFRGARVFLVRGEAAAGVAEEVSALWEAVGGEPRWVEAEAHDRLMSWASHLPQLVANALAAALADAEVSPDDMGPGGRDMTRLASSSSELWRGLLSASRAEGGEGLSAMIRELERVAGLLEAGETAELQAYMERTRRWREGEG